MVAKKVVRAVDPNEFKKEVTAFLSKVDKSGTETKDNLREFIQFYSAVNKLPVSEDIKKLVKAPCKRILDKLKVELKEKAKSFVLFLSEQSNDQRERGPFLLRMCHNFRKR